MIEIGLLPAVRVEEEQESGEQDGEWPKVDSCSVVQSLKYQLVSAAGSAMEDQPRKRDTSMKMRLGIPSTRRWMGDGASCRWDNNQSVKKPGANLQMAKALPTTMPVVLETG
ncbi:hypothetical protein CKAH01_00918 [Colletotrichum kahawae]|uniref:Uncharacterized protein n=1 Tax=Colletotrichum kahawae TaxID=34407 RepID=A0AAE0D913_COLKA|nr:hypothetical protein CKAH01_00918 [Colletotrichum kahawae]